MDKDWKNMESVNTSNVREGVWIFFIIPSITITLFLDNGLQSGEKAYHMAIL